MIVSVAFTKALSRHWRDQHQPTLYRPSSTLVIGAINISHHYTGHHRLSSLARSTSATIIPAIINSRHWRDQHQPPLYRPSSTIVLSTITKPGFFANIYIQNIDTAAQAFKHTFTSHISSANSLQVGSVLTVTRSSSERATWECERGITDT